MKPKSTDLSHKQKKTTYHEVSCLVFAIVFPEQGLDRCFAGIHLPHCFALSARSHGGQHETGEGQVVGNILGWAEDVWLELGPEKIDSLPLCFFGMMCSFTMPCTNQVFDAEPSRFSTPATDI